MKRGGSQTISHLHGELFEFVWPRYRRILIAGHGHKRQDGNRRGAAHYGGRTRERDRCG